MTKHNDDNREKDRESYVRARTEAKHDGKSFLVSPQFEVQSFKKASKGAKVSMNDMLIGSIMQSIGQMGDKSDQGHYLCCEMPMAVHKPSEIEEYPPRIYNGITTAQFVAKCGPTLEENSKEVETYTKYFKEPGAPQSYFDDSEGFLGSSYTCCPCIFDMDDFTSMLK